MSELYELSQFTIQNPRLKLGICHCPNSLPEICFGGAQVAKQCIKDIIINFVLRYYKSLSRQTTEPQIWHEI
jgi:hypothetical protein